MTDIIINRRIVLGGTLCMISASALLGCKDTKTQIFRVEKDGQFFSSNELTILSDVAEIMIPQTETPGAQDAHVMTVLDAMMITWAGTKTKSQFKNIVSQITKLAHQRFSKPYTALVPTDRLLLIEGLDSSSFKKKDTELSKNYRRLKEIIFHIYYSSEKANPDFALIPGQYDGNLTKAQYSEMMGK